MEKLEADLRNNLKSSIIGDEPDDPIIQPEADINSVANVLEAKILRYDLELELNFEDETIAGTVVIEVESLIDLK